MTTPKDNFSCSICRDGFGGNLVCDKCIVAVETLRKSTADTQRHTLEALPLMNIPMRGHGVHRMNITIQKSLKARIDKILRKHPYQKVNWSMVAAKAFEKVVTELENRK